MSFAGLGGVIDTLVGPHDTAHYIFFGIFLGVFIRAPAFMGAWLITQLNQAVHPAKRETATLIEVLAAQDSVNTS
jgi:hypothetical protein